MALLGHGGCTGAATTTPGAQPGRTYAELTGGPLGGLLLDITGWDPGVVDDGAALISPNGRYGPGGRSPYGPLPGDPLRWEWQGDIP